jgi:hypothetical protein
MLGLICLNKVCAFNIETVNDGVHSASWVQLNDRGGRGLHMMADLEVEVALEVATRFPMGGVPTNAFVRSLSTPLSDECSSAYEWIVDWKGVQLLDTVTYWVSESTSQWFLSSVCYSAGKFSEEVSAVSDQWRCYEVKNQQKIARKTPCHVK